MYMKDLESNMKEALKEQSSHLTISDSVKEQIDMGIETNRRCTYKLYTGHFRKYALVAACLCLFTGTVCFAGGKVTNIISTTNSKRETSNFQDVDKLLDKTGLSDANYAAEFENGFAFESANTYDESGLDDDNNKVRNSKGVSLDYTNIKNDEITLDISPSSFTNLAEDDSYLLITSEDGKTYYYQKQTYKFVPTDYVLTEEDKEAVANGTLEISEGTDEVEVSDYQFLAWEEDGITYMLYGEDLEISSDDMIQMAKEM